MTTVGDDIELKPLNSLSGAYQSGVKMRTTESTQPGHDEAQIQHVRFDDGTGNHTVSVSATDLDIRALNSTDDEVKAHLATHLTTGTLGALNATVAVPCDGGMGTLVFEVSGTWKGKIVVEGAVDGTYNNLSIVQPGGAIAFTGVNNDNQNGVYRALIIAGYTNVRLRMSEYTSGTATVIMNAAQLIPTAFVWQLNQANLLATTYQGGTWNVNAQSTDFDIRNLDHASDSVAVVQHVTANAANSSTDNLTSGNSYTFTGTSTSTLGVGGIQVSLKTDKNCTVYIEQSPDGNNWDIVDSYEYLAPLNNFGVTVQAINSYTRVRVVGTVETTYFRLQTALCPIVESLPRSLDSRGHLQVGIKSVSDKYGFASENTPMGELRTAEPTRIVGAQFDGTTVDPNFWTATVANSATVTQGNAQVVLTSGTNSAGSAKLNSVRRARYVGGTGIRYRAVIQLGDTGTASNIRQWGIAYGATMPTITDGAYFQLSGTTFSIVTLKGGSPTTVNSGSFNGNIGATYTPGTGATTYEIYWTNSKVYFVVSDEILHTVSATAATWADTMEQYIYLQNVNSGNTTSVTLSCRVASIYRLGRFDTQPTSKYFSGQTAATVCKYGAGNLHGIAVSGVGNNSAITLYDNVAASGTILWSSGAMAALTQPFDIDLHSIPFSIGLTLVIATANSTVTIAYE